MPQNIASSDRLAYLAGNRRVTLHGPTGRFTMKPKRPDYSKYCDRASGGMAKKCSSSNAVAAFQGAAYAVTCTNGTTAIEMGLRAIGVTAGDEVIVPPYTFIATASAVVTVGGVPVFADIDPDTLCLDPAGCGKEDLPASRAIVPVHVGGRTADMDRINELAKKHNLAVLEDAAHAWGSKCDGRGAGTLGRCGTFSFQVSKNITAGEGGILVTNEKDLADLCRSFSHCGRTEGSAWYDHNYLGSNLRMTEFQAALLLASSRGWKNMSPAASEVQTCSIKHWPTFRQFAN